MKLVIKEWLEAGGNFGASETWSVTLNVPRTATVADVWCQALSERLSGTSNPPNHMVAFIRGAAGPLSRVRLQKERGLEGDRRFGPPVPDGWQPTTHFRWGDPALDTTTLWEHYVCDEDCFYMVWNRERLFVVHEGGDARYKYPPIQEDLAGTKFYFEEGISPDAPKFRSGGCASRTSTVGDLKLALESTTGVPAAEQRIAYYAPEGEEVEELDDTIVLLEDRRLAFVEHHVKSSLLRMTRRQGGNDSAAGASADGASAGAAAGVACLLNEGFLLEDVQKALQDCGGKVGMARVVLKFAAATQDSDGGAAGESKTDNGSAAAAKASNNNMPVPSTSRK